MMSFQEIIICLRQINDCAYFLLPKRFSAPFIPFRRKRAGKGYQVRIQEKGLIQDYSWIHAQIYTPSYLQNGKPRPYITSAPKSVDYNVGFSVGFSNTTSLDRVVLNRLASSTHGVHFDQRQVVLDCSTTGFSSSCQSPPNSSVAPPGQYQLFASFQGVPSKASIVTLNMVANTTAVDGNLGSGLPRKPSEALTTAPSTATTGWLQQAGWVLARWVLILTLTLHWLSFPSNCRRATSIRWYVVSLLMCKRK